MSVDRSTPSPKPLLRIPVHEREQNLDGAELETLAGTRPEPFLAHEARDPLLAHVDVLRLRQLLLDARSAVPLLGQPLF
jgi:hypothetical protein